MAIPLDDLAIREFSIYIKRIFVPYAAFKTKDLIAAAIMTLRLGKIK